MEHSFFFPETVKAFTVIAEKEPSCAMAYWGIAISQRPNPLVGPFPGDVLKRGWEAIEKARAASQKTEREIAWIEALATYYEHYATVPQQKRTANYEAAMAQLWARYPDDAEAAIFYALALNEAADPVDKTYAKQIKAADILEKLEPNQPSRNPALHHPQLRLSRTRHAGRARLPHVACISHLPRGTALHMPSHVFSTLGMWQEVIGSDRAADQETIAYTARVDPKAAADPAKNAGRYHFLDFLTNAYLQLRQDQQAKIIVDRAIALLSIRRAFATAGTRPFGHTRPLRIRARCVGGSRSAGKYRKRHSRKQRRSHGSAARSGCPRRRSGEGQGGNSSTSLCSKTGLPRRTTIIGRDKFSSRSGSRGLAYAR